MNRKEERDIIERALGPLFRDKDVAGRYAFHDGAEYGIDEFYPSRFLDALGKQAIVIGCEVEHTFDRVHLYDTQFPMTIIKKGVFVFETLQGHHGDEGPALAIIISLPKKENG